MSAPGPYAEGLGEDPLMLDFVDWLTTRTNNGLVSWDAKPNLITAKLLGPLVAEFVIVSMADERVWTQFTIRDEDGKEVFRAYPQNIAGEGLPHAQVTEGLFVAVMKRVGGT